MDTRTGEIVDELKEKKDKTANFYKLIPPRLLAQLYGMNRKQRREWYRKHKKEFQKK